MPFSDDKYRLHDHQRSRSLITFFYERTMRPIGTRNRHHRTVCRVTMYLTLGDDWLIPFDLFDDAMSLAAIASYVNMAVLAFSYCLFPHETFTAESRLIHDEQKRSGCDLRLRTNFFEEPKMTTLTIHTTKPPMVLRREPLVGSSCSSLRLFSSHSSTKHSRASMPSPIQV